MNRNSKILVAKSAVAAVVIPAILYAFAAGPDPRHTGAPGDQTCAKATCHVGTPAMGGVEIDFPSGTSYTPGVRQRWTVRITGATGRVYGFQATARLASNLPNGQAGGFFPVDGRTLVLCDDGKDKNQSPVGCNAQTPVEFIEHRLAGSSNSFTFEWAPPAENVGNVRVYVAGNAANGNGQADSGDRIFLANFTLWPPPQIRTEQPVLQVFSGIAGLSSGTWLEIYGTNLSSTTREWAGSDFSGNRAPTVLDGVSVNINSRPAFVRYISPTQINVQAPDDDSTGPVSVEVVNPGGRASVTVNKTRTSPALLTTPAFIVGGRQYVAALHTDLQTFVGRTNLIAGVPFRPARPNDRIIIYAVGCGPTNPASPAGVIVSEVSPLASPFQVSFGTTAATEAQAFLSPPFIGLCRFDVTVPNVPDGDIQIDARVDGTITGQTLFTTIQR